MKIPDRDTVFGLFTRLTPFWFHRLYKRHLRNLAESGKAGCGPFPTVYDKVVSRKGVHEYCGKKGLSILEEVGRDCYFGRSGKVAPFLETVLFKTVNILSFGKLASRHNGLTYILAKGSSGTPKTED